MKKLSIMVISLLLISSLVYAETKGEMVIAIGNIAASVMKARQADMPFGVLADTVQKRVDSKEQIELVLTMMQEAYKVSIMSSQEDKQKAINDFRNKWMLSAYNLIFKGEEL